MYTHTVEETCKSWCYGERTSTTFESSGTGTYRMFCSSGRKCLRTSLDNTRHASTLNSVSQTQRFLPACAAFKELHGTSSSRIYFFRKFQCFSINALYICGEKKEHSFCFCFFSFGLCSLKTSLLGTCCARTCLRLSVPPQWYTPSHSRGVTLFVSGCRPKTSLRENSQCVTYSRTLLHFMAFFYCCAAAIWMYFFNPFFARISQLRNDFQHKHFAECST